MVDSTVTLFVISAPNAGGAVAAGTYTVTGTRTIVYSNNGDTNGIDSADRIDGQPFSISTTSQPQFNMNDSGTIPANSGYVLYVTLADGTVLMGFGDASGPDNTDINDTPYDELLANGSGIASITLPSSVSAFLFGNSWDTYYLGGIPDIICFTSGTLIRTECGERPVESLSAGDMVVTPDHGVRPIRWIGRRKLSSDALQTNPKFRPIMITAGSLGADLPRRNLRVSPQHRMLISSRITERMFGQQEVLVAANKLCVLPGIYVDEDVPDVEYFHILFDKHEIIYAEGSATESLYPGPQALKSLTEAARAEVFMLFPELADKDYTAEPAKFIPMRKQQMQLLSRHLKNHYSDLSTA